MLHITQLGTRILFDIGYFEPSALEEGCMRAPRHNFVVFVPIITKFGIGMKLDVFYAMVTTQFVTSLLLRDNLWCLNFRYL